MRTMVDLCAGVGGWQEPFTESDEWFCVGVDIADMSGVSVRADVRSLPLQDDGADVVTASPPCTEFARWMLPWLDEPNPSLELVEACLSAIDLLDPDWWVMENSRGLHMYWRESVTHAGPYYLWGDFPPTQWPQDLESKQQTTGMNPEERARIPHSVASAFKESVEVYC